MLFPEGLSDRMHLFHPPINFEVGGLAFNK